MYDHGSRVNSPLFALFWAARDGEGGARAGFTTPRALGNAVIRNRIRRRMREAVRQELPRVRRAIDFIFHPRRAVLDAAFPRLRAEVEAVLRKWRTS